jgi:hypothetical protein
MIQRTKKRQKQELILLNAKNSQRRHNVASRATLANAQL